VADLVVLPELDPERVATVREEFPAVAFRYP